MIRFTEPFIIAAGMWNLDRQEIIGDAQKPETEDYHHGD